MQDRVPPTDSSSSLHPRAAPEAGAPARRILVCIYSWYYFRHISPALETLAQQGHRLHVVAIKHDRVDFRTGMEELCARYPRVSFQVGPERQDDWIGWAQVIRLTQSYLQSKDARFDQACRNADAKRLRGRYPTFLDSAPFRSAPGREFTWRSLRRLNDALPTDATIDAVFESFRPDVMLITPLIDREGMMWDFMASAQKAGVRSVFPVHSWDNLSSKARINIFPDRVLVWNETQRDEAVRFHHVPQERIAVTGAQGFDDWFEMQPSMSRDAFCASLGFDPDCPILLFVCSAMLKRHMAHAIATDKTEMPFFTRWIAALRAAPDPRLREANVIVRPHPKREDHWDDVNLREFGRVVVHPRHGRLPNNPESKTVFFDSLYHAEAVIGLNTSAMIEAGIVGRPVMTVLEPDYRAGQVEMQHFQYLLKVAGGLLIAAKDYDEHVQQLSAQLENAEDGRRRAREFTRAFVRPRGMALSAAPLVAEVVVETAALGPAEPRTSGFVDRVLRRLLTALEGARTAHLNSNRPRSRGWMSKSVMSTPADRRLRQEKRKKEEAGSPP